jgi:pimeloyl-ACP methyl ester carboxylesterase
LLGTSPRYLDTHAELVEQRLRAKCKAAIDRSMVAVQLHCLSGSEVDPPYFRILSPTLVIAGEDDHLIPSCYGRAMAQKISDNRFVMIQGAGHNPLQECPSEVLPLIIDFLNQTGDAKARTDQLQTSELST